MRSTGLKPDVKRGYYLRYYKKLDESVTYIFPTPN